MDPNPISCGAWWFCGRPQCVCRDEAQKSLALPYQGDEGKCSYPGVAAAAAGRLVLNIAQVRVGNGRFSIPVDGEADLGERLWQCASAKLPHVPSDIAADARQAGLKLRVSADWRHLLRLTRQGRTPGSVWVGWVAFGGYWWQLNRVGRARLPKCPAYRLC